MLRLPLFLSLVLAGCTGGPQPIPALDPQAITYTDTELRAQPGSAPRGMVRVTELFDPATEIIVPVADDGSFVAPWTPADVDTRLQVIDGDERSPVLDVVRDGDQAVRRPVRDCVALPLELPVATGSVGEELLIPVGLQNNCAVGLDVLPTSMTLSADFGFEGLGAGFELTPGEVASTFSVSIIPDAPGSYQGRLMVVVLPAGGVEERRAIEVYAEIN